MVYSTGIGNMVKIRALFRGYIFRRTEDGVGYVQASTNQKAIIEANGIELTLIN